MMISSSSASLSWNPPAHTGGQSILNYGLYMSSNNGASYSTACFVLFNVFSCVVKNLLPNQAYVSYSWVSYPILFLILNIYLEWQHLTV